MATVATIKNQVAKRTEEQPIDIATFIRKNVAELKKAVPSVMSAERLCRIAVTTIRLNPKLADCSKASLLGALFQSAQLGLEPNVEGQAYLIPYKNKKTINNQTKYVWECQFQIGYKGYIELFYRHSNAVSIDVHAIYENDIFEYAYGTDAYIKHCPVLKDRGGVVGYYAVAKLKSGGTLFKVMSKEECIEHGKTHSKTFITKEWDDAQHIYVPVTPHFDKNSPWSKDTDAMCKKTVLIQLAKLLPKSVELRQALAMDNTTKTDIDANMFNIPDSTNWDVEENLTAKLPPADGDGE